MLRANVSKFGAYKAYHVTKVLKNILNDDEIPFKQKEEYSAKALKIFDNWQKTENNTAVTRSRTAKQFEQFMQTDNIRLFPNLRWIPSRSVVLREKHKPFYNRVWAKNDPFWTQNTPGSLWNCKCDWQETDDPVTNKNPQANTAAIGLEGNPAVTGEVFTNNASYIKKAPGSIEIDSETAKQYKNLQSLVSIDTKKWRLDYYTDNEGYLQTNRLRIKESEQNKQEKAKFDKEYSMCRTLALNKFHIVYLQTMNMKGSFDIFLNSIPCELKKTKSHNNIVDYALKAIKKQGAKIVVFEFEKFNSDIINELQKLTNSDIHGYFYITGENKIRTF